MFFRPTIQVELEQEDSKAVKEIYIRGDDLIRRPHPHPPATHYASASPPLTGSQFMPGSFLPGLR